MVVHTMLSIFLKISLLFLARAENVCNPSSGFSPSPSSCSSYFYCDDAGEEQEAQCGEGLLWSKDLHACDQEQNVSCGKGLFWFFRRGSSFLKVGLQLASIAHRVTTKLVGPLTGDAAGNETIHEQDDADRNNVQEHDFQQKLVIKNNGNDQQRKIENVTKTIQNTGIIPLQDYEGSGSFLETDDTEDEDDNDLGSGIADKEDNSEKDKIINTNFVTKKEAVIEPLKARSRSLKQQTLPKYGDNVTEKIQEDFDDNLHSKIAEDHSKSLSLSDSTLREPATTPNPSQPRSALPWIVSKWIPS